MPRYDYQCKKCQSIFEVKASVKEKEAGLKVVCPTCQSLNTYQMITASVILTGGTNGAGPTSSCCGSNSSSGCCG